jgi:adenylate kinase
MPRRPVNLVFLGPPGAGKGTQAAMAAMELGIAHISTGDLLREEMRNGSELGRRAEEYINRGALVPDDVMIAMVRKRLGDRDAENGFVLDGFPRTVTQADALHAMLGEIGKGLDAVVSMELDDAEIVRRIAGRLTCRSCGAVFHAESRPPAVEGVCDACGGELYQRSDNGEDAVRARLATYREQTAPLLDYYAERSLLRPVAAGGSIEAVHTRVVGALGGSE